jgi:glycosyltransferase involved in cell wall biosynthesis
VTVLALFGGGTSLKWSAGHVNTLETVLNEGEIPHCWLLLGGVPREWFSLSTPVLIPGWLDSNALSAHLQLTDIVLMPHAFGLSAKRGTLMAALEHALPVVGTKGALTDSFWSALAGVMMVDIANAADFAAAVAVLCPDRRRQQTHGLQNAKYYREQLAWPNIAQKFLGAIDTN